MSVLTYSYPPSGTVTNGSGTALRVDAAWLVNFGEAGDEIRVTLAYRGHIAHSLLPGGLAAWISDRADDNSGTGTLLASLELPTAGTGPGFLAVTTTTFALNPGGVGYLLLTSFAGENGEEGGFESVELSYQAASIGLDMGDIVYDAVAAAQFGISLRQAPRA